MLELHSKKEFKDWKNERGYKLFGKGVLIKNNNLMMALGNKGTFYNAPKDQKFVLQDLTTEVFATVYDYSEIKSINLLMYPTTRKRHKILRTVVGGAVFAPLAVVGYLSGQDADDVEEKYSIEFTTTDGQLYTYSERLTEKAGKRRVNEAKRIAVAFQEIQRKIDQVNGVADDESK